MSKNFEINHNFSRLPHNYRCLFLEVNQPELAAFCHQGVVCISFVLWQGDWMIERSGKLQSPHLDFYWIYGEGFVVEHKGGVIHAEPGYRMRKVPESMRKPFRQTGSRSPAADHRGHVL